MNDVRARGPPPSLELGILGSFLTRLNFRFYPSPGEIMLTTNPPPPAPSFSSPPLPLPTFLRLYFSFFGGGGGGGGGGGSC